MPPTWPQATWMPTPVRNPMSTVRDRKSARNPRPMSRATIRNAPAISASRPARATYSVEPGGGEAGQAGRHDRGGGRVGADDEVARRAEDGEHEHRQQDRVEPGDHRHAGDRRVAHHLGDGERGQRDAGHDLRRDPRPVDRQQALEDGQATAWPAAWRCRVLRRRPWGSVRRLGPVGGGLRFPGDATIGDVATSIAPLESEAHPVRSSGHPPRVIAVIGMAGPVTMA